MSLTPIPSLRRERAAEPFWDRDTKQWYAMCAVCQEDLDVCEQDIGHLVTCNNCGTDNRIERPEDV